MDDRCDIERAIISDNYLERIAKYKVGDIVHTWINNKCVVYTVYRRYDRGDTIVYHVRDNIGILHEVCEDLLCKVGHTSVDMDSFAPVLF